MTLRAPALGLTVLLAVAAPATATTPVPANTGSARVDYAAREWIDVGLDVHGVSVDRLRLRRPNRARALILRHDEPNRGVIVVTNRTDKKVAPAVAAAVFDADGRLLAATNTGHRLRSVLPGETVEMDVHFGGVFRHVENGHWIYVSLEY